MYSTNFRNACKLFDEITHRYSCRRNILNILHYVSLSQKHTYHEFPTDSLSVIDGNVLSLTSKISHLVKQNKPEEAIGLFKTMLMYDRKPNYVTLITVARAFGVLDCEELMNMVHGLVVKLGFESEGAVLTAILGFYCNYDLGAGLKLFDEIVEKDVVLWTAMVRACVKSGNYLKAFDFFRKMQCYGVEPNHVTFVSVLPACSYIDGGLYLGKQIHGYLTTTLFGSFTNVQNSLMSMYSKCGNVEASMWVFSGTQDKNLVSWKTVIHGCIENQCYTKALNIFSMMKSSCFEPEEAIVRDVVAALTHAQETNKYAPSSLHCYILKKGFLNFAFIRPSLLQCYARFGELDMAKSLFDELELKDVIMWSTMISLHARGGQPYDSFSTFKQMQLNGEKPNEFTLVALLLASSSMGAEEMGVSIHAHVVKLGYSSNAYLISALIDLYCKFGKAKQAKALFEEKPTTDLICWSSMIKGYRVNGYGEEALETFSRMLDRGVMPNDIVFISVLSACSHCGLEYEGWSWFNMMKEKYGITPNLAHYACMVDLLSRRGKVEEALDFVKKMPVEPDKLIWGAILAGCASTDGSIEIAEFAVERLCNLDSQNIVSYYMILLDLYAEEGRWDDVEKLRKLVDEKRHMLPDDLT